MFFKKLLDYVLGSIYMLYFGMLLCIFHPIQYVVFNLYGQKSHQRVVEILNFFIVKGWILTGSTSSFEQKSALPPNQTLIFVSNHQSLFDIPGIIWYLRKHIPLFISKKELSKGIPSISYNLRIGHAALIDRNDPKQAIVEIIKFTNYIKQMNYSGVIFPEGTRSRTGKLKPFLTGGIATLVKKCPDALIVPIAIKNTSKFNPKSLWPLTSFTHMSWTCLEPISSKNISIEDLTKQVENQISNYIS